MKSLSLGIRIGLGSRPLHYVQISCVERFPAGVAWRRYDVGGRQDSGRWFVEKEYGKEALIIRDFLSRGIVAPSLLYFEMLDALKYSEALGEDELNDQRCVLCSLSTDRGGGSIHRR